jgi:hypothetical protein
MYISYFAYLSAYICLGFFYLLAIVNNAIMNMGLQSLFELLLSISLGMYPEA